MNKKELKNNEKFKNKTTSKNCSTLISNHQLLTSNHQPLISDHKGITLIALVITIIVMLILVGVTVTVALNGGLFSQAKEAVNKTQLEVDRESLLSAVLGCIGSEAEVDFDELNNNLPKGFEIVEDGQYLSESGNTFYVDKYGNVSTQKTEGGSGQGGGSNQGGTEPGGGGTSSTGNWKLDEDGNTASNEEVTVNIGDYVNYTYDEVTEAYSLPIAKTGYTEERAINQTNGLKWRVLGVDANGCLTLISDKPTSKTTIGFGKAIGYNNGVYILNDICAKQYSNKTLGVTARSLTIEDVEGGFSDEAKTARDSYTDEVKYGESKTYSGDSFQYPAIYEQEKRRNRWK